MAIDVGIDNSIAENGPQTDLNLEGAAKRWEQAGGVVANSLTSAAGKAGATVAGKILQGFEDGGAALKSSIADISKTITDAFDSYLDKFMKNQESIEYNLTGSMKSYKDITEKVSDVLTTSSYANITTVYEKLTKLLDEGLIYNVEQRAYLASMTEKYGVKFDFTSKQLNRLVNLWREDISAERLAINSSLQEFLVQNYQTSQYIKDGFQGVSEALIEAQSMMGVQSAMEMESAVQKWLGSMSSVGMTSETISSLASALGQLGSGDATGLAGSSMQNLLVMGAAAGGLNYAELLTNGLNENAIDKLMQGIVDVMAALADDSSNVVRSEYAKVLGIKVSDMMASTSIVDAGLGSVQIGTSIYDFLENIQDATLFTSQLNTLLENMTSGAALSVSGSDLSYTLYETVKLVSGVGAALTKPLDGAGPFSKIYGAFAAAPGIYVLGATLNNLLGSIDDYMKGFTEGGQQGTGNLLFDEFNRFGESKKMSTFSYGDITSGEKKGRSTSYAGGKSNINDSTLTESSRKSANQYVSEEDSYDASDIYNLLVKMQEAVPTTTFLSSAEVVGDVAIGGTAVGSIQSLLALSTINIQNIYTLLVNHLTGAKKIDSGLITNTSSASDILATWTNSSSGV